jgi:6-pyruvoyltetrahydropterin/6-carboxytetrahydropterin synthase
VFRVTRQYRFAASHRLHAAGLSGPENQALYGKCNNPYGHGHNYLVDVSARGPLDARTGRVLDVRLLDQFVAQQVLAPFDHRNINTEVESLEHVVPTSENLARDICRRLKDNWSTVFPGEWPKLEKIRIAETPRNIFEIRVDEI